jgi:hypothetical protein
MEATTSVPIIVAPEAAARVQELGMQRELEAMLDHTRQHVAGLQSIEVILYHDETEPGQPRVIIAAHLDDSGPANDDPVSRQWGRWFVTTFAPTVRRWFGFDALYRDDDAR